MKDTDDIQDLLQKYLHNRCSPEEAKRLLRYFHQDNIDQHRLMDLIERHLQNPVEAPDNEQRTRMKARYAHLISTIREQGQPVHSRSARRLFVRIAVAAAALLLLTFSWIFRRDVYERINPVSDLKLIALPGETRQITLPDGTEVWLNAGSELSYPSSFRDSLRVVQLSGEAYFKVSPRADQPFVMKTGSLETRVLGTSLNIKAYPGEENIRVTVLTGKVAVAADKGRGREILTASQQTVFHTGQQRFTTRHIDDPAAAIAWRKGQLIFNGAPLKEVAAALQRKYDIRLSVEEGLADCPVFADFQDEPVTQILELIALSFEGKITQNDRNYYLSGRPCR